MKRRVLLISYNYNACLYGECLEFIYASQKSEYDTRYLVIPRYSDNMQETICRELEGSTYDIVYFLCDFYDIISSDLAHIHSQKIRSQFPHMYIGIQSENTQYFQTHDVSINQFLYGGAEKFAYALDNIHSQKEICDSGNLSLEVSFPYHDYIIDYEKFQTFVFETESFCKYSCTFCYKSEKIPSRHKTIDAIKTYLDVCYVLGFKKVWFLDPTINENQNLSLLISLIQSYDFCFIFEIRPESFSLQEYSLFSQLDQEKVFNVGLQSSSIQVARNIQRGFHDKNYRKGIMWLQKLGRVHIDLILGLPGETKKSFLEVYIYAERLQVDAIRVFLLENRPNSFHNVAYTDDRVLFHSEYPYKIKESSVLTSKDINVLSSYFQSRNIEFN